jgi:hypothetical protein
MKFYLAIVLAAVVAWLAGAAWYMALSKPWMAALGGTPDEIAAAKQAPGAYRPFVYAFAAELVMAWILAGVLLHLEPRVPLTVRSGIISGAFCWFGFVITAMLVNYSFARRDWRLLWIDGGHWLLVLVLMGAVIGAIGR